MSSQRFRILRNKLINELSIMRYLEVGAIQESTIVAALDQDHKYSLSVGKLSKIAHRQKN